MKSEKQSNLSSSLAFLLGGSSCSSCSHDLSVGVDNEPVNENDSHDQSDSWQSEEPNWIHEEALRH